MEFSTGSLGSDIPTYNVTIPITTCTLRLVLTDNLGQNSTKSVTVTVSVLAARARALFNCPRLDCAPSAIQRDAHATSMCMIISTLLTHAAHGAATGRRSNSCPRLLLS